MWIGFVLTAWCAYFFRDPERLTPQDDDLVISPADGRVSAVAMVTPPDQAPYFISVFLSDADADYETRNDAVIALSQAVMDVVTNR